MNCIELSDNPFQGVWIVWFAMLMLAAGCDSIRRRRHHCRASERRVQGLHDAHDAHDATCVVS